MKSIYSGLTLPLLCLAVAPTLASETLEEITVVSSRVEMPLRQVGTSVSIVTREELDIRGFEGLANSLRYEPGIAVNNNGGAGKVTTLQIRGERGFRTRLLIDGIEATDTSAPQAGPNFAHLSSAGISRVEILRGPQGMMYGADAGGVISVSTLAPREGVTGGLSAEYGRYDSTDVNAFLAGGNERVDYALTASQFDTDGFNARDTDTVLRDDDGYQNTTFHGRAGWNVLDDLRLEVVARQVEGDSDYDTCFDPVSFDEIDDCRNEYEQNAWRGAIVHEGEAFSNSLSYNVNETERTLYDAGQRGFATEGELAVVNYLGSWSGSDALRLVYGAELRDESLDDGSTDYQRDQQGYFAEYQGSFNDALFLTAGARYDDNDDFGSETTYRLSAAYLLPVGADEVKFRGTYGTGFRAPSLTEVSYNAGPFATPPARGTQLSAEKSKGYDLGVAWLAASGWMLEAVYFDQVIDRQIYFDTLAYSGYLQEADESTSRGVELAGSLPLSGWGEWGEWVAIEGNYTYNDTEDSEGEQRIRAPKHLANLGLRLSPWQGRLNVNLNLRISNGVADDIDGAVDDYEVLDLSASYRLLPGLELFGRIENLLDEDYQELPTYNTSGRAGYAGLRYTF